MIRPPHPFPARMAPELAIAALETLPPKSTILDPMTGSGVVLRQAVEKGHIAIGYDLDPLAVLMSKVWTKYISAGALTNYVEVLITTAANSKIRASDLPWADEKTQNFMRFWFAKKQHDELAKLAFFLHEAKVGKQNPHGRNLLSAACLCLSRIIITKSGGASLASDTSHSRPHRTRTESDFDVYAGLRIAAKKIEQICSLVPQQSSADVRHGDARDLRGIKSNSIDAIITSPPYLNAIDYMRGHKLALVWLGHQISELAGIRSTSIGAEKATDKPLRKAEILDVRGQMFSQETLSTRQLGMIDRYITDLDKLAARCARVLKPSGLATYVVGNSCLKGTFISNSNCMKYLSEKHGLLLIKEIVRELPENRRYLPVTGKTDNPLKKRMRTETILTMQKAA